MKSQTVSLIFGLLVAGNVLSIVIAATAYEFATRPAVQPPTLVSIQERLSKLESKQTAAEVERSSSSTPDRTSKDNREELREAVQGYVTRAQQAEIDEAKQRLQTLKQQTSEYESQIKEHEANVQRLVKEQERDSEIGLDEIMEARNKAEEKALKARHDREKKILEQRQEKGLGVGPLK